MPRYKAVISYDGTNYAGFQIQNNAHTIQAEIENTLRRINGGKSITIHPSGRTDSGVHAKGQVIHFDYPHERDSEKFRFALDTQTPADICFLSVEQVDDEFHARYLAKEKIYHYHVDLGQSPDPFKRLYSAHYRYTPDLDIMKQAAKYIEGEHDFSIFCATGSAVQDKTRTIHEVTIEKISETELIFIFRGNGFLYKMVRMLVGTLLKIGNGQLPVDAIEKALLNQDKKMTGPTAHPEGLFLMNVSYK
ncbi:MULTISPECIES: tRNA pseudouridine(38-40) synthase TruA [Vagococcus]|uniref:tRNA pseudouridine synthase A n=1 Tax=Vagococcus fluvialis bH819 TaxID=1255619 RepID=A0A1X6WKJ5_9ENTE|nr:MULTISPECIES: tRNA pseudouridine(38-40) synthase TruA [Vagococcus]SLM84851.1 tRNA pseudouridine synthase A [Vagococcus fluvialis bH819]HCM89156.1 tRNA pseudouridine(38-40) synthase TruA [Vagococcus sp.]